MLVPIPLARLLAMSFSVVFFVASSSAQNDEANNWLLESSIEEHLLGKSFKGFLSHHWSMHHYWSECIDLNGTTVYRSWSTEQKVGKLFTRSPDQACFDYGDEVACFRVRPFLDGYIFRPVSGGLADLGVDFIVGRVESQTHACKIN